MHSCMEVFQECMQVCVHSWNGKVTRQNKTLFNDMGAICIQLSHILVMYEPLRFNCHHERRERPTPHVQVNGTERVGCKTGVSSEKTTTFGGPLLLAVKERHLWAELTAS